MKKTFYLNLMIVLTLISCSSDQRNLHGLDEELLETETKNYILSDKQARNYVKKEVTKISDFEVNLLSCYPKELLIEYLEKEISHSENFATKLKTDYEETRISVYYQMMKEENSKVDSLYKVLANTNPKDSIYECHYYLKNDFNERPDDDQFLSHWQNRVDKNSRILDHLVLIGFDD